MRKVTIHYSLFVILFLLGLFQAVSGFIMWFILPRGGQGRGFIALLVVKLPSGHCQGMTGATFTTG